MAEDRLLLSSLQQSELVFEALDIVQGPSSRGRSSVAEKARCLAGIVWKPACACLRWVRRFSCLHVDANVQALACAFSLTCRRCPVVGLPPTRRAKRSDPHASENQKHMLAKDGNAAVARKSACGCILLSRFSARLSWRACRICIRLPLWLCCH